MRRAAVRSRPPLTRLLPHLDEPNLRRTLAAEAAGHPGPFEDARRRRGSADRARLPDVVRAVRLRAAVEPVPLDRSGESLAVRDAADLHLLARREDVHGDVFAAVKLALAA